MSKSRFETKVGLFVFIGLVLLAFLLLQFSKSTSLFRPTYNLLLTTKSAGGLKEQASVLMAGVPVGTVSDISLAPDGNSVTITLKIYDKFAIRENSQFVIKQSGFLGDNYVAISQGEHPGRPLAPGARAEAQEPFDLQEVARSAAGFLQRMDDAAKKVNDTIVDLRRLLLNEETLTNLSAAVGSMRAASDRALTTIESLNTLFTTNGEAISRSASNVVVFSEELTRAAASLQEMLTTNREDVTASVKNIESSTVVLKTLLEDVQAGKGPVGTLLRNEKVASDVAAIANNLSITTSNLNRLGLWGILWSHKPPRTNRPPSDLAPPRDPFRSP